MGPPTGICSTRDCCFTNAVHHTSLFWKETERARENCWAWITDYLPISTGVVFNNLDDVNLVKALLRDCSLFDNNMNLLNADILLLSAKYISYCL